MNYTYEIIEYNANTLSISVRYTSDNENHQELVQSFRLGDLSEEAVRDQIETFAHVICDTWEKSVNAPPMLAESLTGPQPAVREKLKEILTEPEPEYNFDTQKLVSAVRQTEDNIIEYWEVVDLTEEELADRARGKRFYLLRETDYLVFSDTPEASQAWLDYRQALRDIPAQAGFPTNIVWPTQPE
jgi:hypothetical protein